MRVYITVILIAGMLMSCKKNSRKDILAENIDKNVDPTEDFFQYANGGWLNNNPVPAAESGWGIGDLVEEEIYERLRNINEKAIKTKATKGTADQKIRDFWATAMDSASRNKNRLNPLQPDIESIKSVTDIKSLMTVGAELQMKGVNCFFYNYVLQDDMNSEVMAFRMDQGGLGMPNRDYYFNNDERTARVREAYRKYLLASFIQLGFSKENAASSMEGVMSLETRLAKSSRKLEDLRDPYENYNKYSVSDLSGLAGVIGWKDYFTQIGALNLDSVIVGQPEFYRALGKELQSTPLNVWKDYLLVQTLMTYADYLDDATYLNYFTYRKSLSGATEPRPRWKRVLDSEEDAMGELLGQLFAKEYFNEKAKKRYSDIVEEVRAAYKERILKLDWMSDSTKQKALVKLAAITKKVGYPDKWKDFSGLEIKNDNYLANMQRANRWWHNYYINKLGKPVDRSEWDMTPQTYNAYYNPSNNEIVLPAGIFTVPGYRDEDLDDGLVYGYAAASTIGHEITHGFDDQGRQYDAKGNLNNWWTKRDEEEFNNRAKAIIRQFSEFIPVDTLHINGEATQGENIADLGGLLIGLDAFKKTDFYKNNTMISGFTPLQRYFMGYALGWMYHTKKERLANLVMTDVHSPPKERVNGPMVNIPEFYKAFNIKKGDKMYRPDSLRVSIW